MSRRLILLAMGVVLLPGCMLGTPMPKRLDVQGQAHCEYGWDHMVKLEPQVERQALMDAIIAYQLWHVGVDRLHFRSEKEVGDVLVVMETHFERSRPDEDAFTVSIYDAQNRLLRREQYTPAEMDEFAELLRLPNGKVESEAPADDDERVARLDEFNARMQRVADVFPQPPDPNEPRESDEIPGMDAVPDTDEDAEP